MTEYTSFDEFTRQLEKVANTTDENPSAVKKQKKTKASVSLVRKNKSAMNRGNKSTIIREAEVSTDMKKMNSFVSEFLTKAEEFRRNIDPTISQSPFTMKELNRVDIKRNAPFFPNLLTANGEVRTKRERVVKTIRDQKGQFSKDSTLIPEELTTSLLLAKAKNSGKRRRPPLFKLSHMRTTPPLWQTVIR